MDTDLLDDLGDAVRDRLDLLDADSLDEAPVRRVTDEDLHLLRLAGAQMPVPGQREQAIARLGLTPVRFWMRVNAMLDSPEALAAEPSVVWRLRRMRERV